MTAIKNRYDFIYLFDVKDANPNGDPDAGNLPRVDVETNQGLVTDVMLKRKVRNYVQLVKKDEPPYDIYVKERGVLVRAHEKAYQALGIDPKGGDGKRKGAGDEVEKARAWMCQNFYDVRTFGAVMSTSVNCGQVRGPVQIAFGRSVDRILPSEHAITRMAVATEKEAQDQKGDNRTMGRKYTVPYALYRTSGYVNPFLAEQTGFSDEDLELLWKALENAFQFDASAARPAGSMAPRLLLVFKHDSALGNVASNALFDRLQIKPFDDEPAADGKPPRSFADYAARVTFDGQPIDAVVKAGGEKDVGNGVTLIRRV